MYKDKNKLSRYFALDEWAPPKPIIPESELPKGAVRRRLATFRNNSRAARTRMRVSRISLIRQIIEETKKYPRPYQRKIAAINIILRDLYRHSGPTGNMGAIFMIPFIVAYSIHKKRTVRTADRALVAPARIMPTRANNETQSDGHPVIAEYLLFVFLRRDDRIQIVGDLQEEFITCVLPKFGLRRARFWFWAQTLTIIWQRNSIFRWLLTGGGIASVGRWLWRAFTG